MEKMRKLSREGTQFFQMETQEEKKERQKISQTVPQGSPKGKPVVKVKRSKDKIWEKVLELKNWIKVKWEPQLWV